MAKGNFTGKGYFKKGVSGNPSGKPKMDPELKLLRTRTRGDVEKIILKLYDKNAAALNKILDDNDTSFWEKHVARIILRGVAKGELAPFLALSDYIFGKQIEKVKMDLISSDRSMSPQVNINLLKNGREPID